MNTVLKRLFEAIAALPERPTSEQVARIKMMRQKATEAPDYEKELREALKPFAVQGVNGGRLVNDIDYERAVRVYEKAGGR